MARVIGYASRPHRPLNCVDTVTPQLHRYGWRVKTALYPHQIEGIAHFLDNSACFMFNWPMGAGKTRAGLAAAVLHCRRTQEALDQQQQQRQQDVPLAGGVGHGDPVKAEADMKQDVKAGVKAEGKWDVKADVKPEVKVKADVKSDGKSDATADVQVKVKADVKSVAMKADADVKADVKDGLEAGSRPLDASTDEDNDRPFVRKVADYFSSM
jgi:hypothetical protein